MNNEIIATTYSNQKCYFCGLNRHSRSKCPAREATCYNCSKTGHYGKICSSQKKNLNNKTSAAILATATFDVSSSSLRKATLTAVINDHITNNVLVDSGSSNSFISEKFADKLKVKILCSSINITMASSELKSTSLGHCYVGMNYNGHFLASVKLIILKTLCADDIIGHDILSHHSTLELKFNGPKSPLKICSLMEASIEPVSLFSNLTADCKPIADRSRQFSVDDMKFIRGETEKLLKEGIIEPSKSPWRAQVHVTKDDHHKKRMVIDYSKTINRFTLLDAYPLPRLDDMAKKIADYVIYSTLDLKSAYHQAPILPSEKLYTGFEANGNLYQFKRVPFGVTNGVACFQRIIDDIIRKENLTDTFAYIDNITVCGKNQESHDRNLKLLYETAEKYNLTFNHDKSILSVKDIALLGYRISHGEIRPDPERITALRNLPIPTDSKSLKRVMGVFSYYSQWIPQFSKRIHTMTNSQEFPLVGDALDAFNDLKTAIEDSVLMTVDPDVPLTVETDASDYAISAVLNQSGRPIAFFSRTLNKSECNHPIIEKEAYAIVEACRKWKHYLLGKSFLIITAQKSVAFMFDSKKKGKIKNDKIMRWRIELSCYQFDIIYREGFSNVTADALSRNISAATTFNQDHLFEIHKSLCHPGITRMLHFLRIRNLPYSTEDVKRMIASCDDCCKLKPKFYKPDNVKLVKATQPFEKLSIDFKGPVPSITKNKYCLLYTSPSPRDKRQSRMPSSA